MDTAMPPSADLDFLAKSKTLFISEENYVGAQLAMEEMDRVKQQNQVEYFQRVVTKHQDELQAIEEANEQAVQEFNTRWDTLVQQKLEESKLQLQDLKQKQTAQLQSEAQRLQDSLSTVYKPSSKLLGLRLCKQKAVKIENFVAADKLKKEIRAMEVAEHEKHMQARENTIQARLEIVKADQAKEVEALKNRHSDAMAKLKTQRDIEFTQLNKKLRNRLAEMQMNHLKTEACLRSQMAKTSLRSSPTRAQPLN